MILLAIERLPRDRDAGHAGADRHRDAIHTNTEETVSIHRIVTRTGTGAQDAGRPSRETTMRQTALPIPYGKGQSTRPAAGNFDDKTIRRTPSTTHPTAPGANRGNSHSRRPRRRVISGPSWLDHCPDHLFFPQRSWPSSRRQVTNACTESVKSSRMYASARKTYPHARSNQVRKGRKLRRRSSTSDANEGSIISPQQKSSYMSPP